MRRDYKTQQQRKHHGTQFRGKFVQVLHVGKSHWLMVSNKHCPPGSVCVYTKGAITANTKNQVAAIMHFKEAEIVLEVDLHAVATAYELCAGNDSTTSHGNTINFAPTLRCLERVKPFPSHGPVKTVNRRDCGTLTLMVKVCSLLYISTSKMYS